MFEFRKFSVSDDMVAMKVGTDGVLIGAWAEGGKHILDVGTGSGLIAIMMAQRYPSARVIAIDIDDDCCKQAKENIAASPFSDRIEVLHSSLQDLCHNSKYNAFFDAIVSNPPFFNKSLKSPDKKKNLAKHNDSLSICDFFKSSKHLLKSDCPVSVIYPIELKEEVVSEAIIDGLSMHKVITIKSSYKKKPRRFMAEFINGYSPLSSTEEKVLNEGNSRSQWYQELTKDFYIR